MHQTKTVAIAEDLCGIGRAALSVSMPVVASYGFQPCPIPTAALSAHTGFENPVKLDMTEFFCAALNAYRTRPFDALMTGYLLNPAQAARLDEFIGAKKKRGDIGLTLIDPAMADNGKLYKSIPETMPAAYQRLIRHGDIITPNATEAAILTDRSPRDPLCRGGLDGLFSDLLSLGPGAVVVKGLEHNGTFFNAHQGQSGAIETYPYKKRPENYPGTGDLFKSILISELLLGANLASAVASATDFVGKAIDAAISNDAEPKEGIPFEPLLHVLGPKRL